jgi:hypothetical protein
MPITNLLEDKKLFEYTACFHFFVASPSSMTRTPEGPSIREAQIIVSIVTPGAPLKITAVYPSTPVSVLNAVVPNSDLFFQGQTLIETRSFSFYGIRANDMIVAIRRTRRTNHAAWIEEHYFGDIARHFINRSLYAESLRLHDTHAIRMETRPKWFRRLCREVELNGGPPPNGQFATQIPPEATAVSSAPLPICW